MNISLEACGKNYDEFSQILLRESLKKQIRELQEEIEQIKLKSAT